MKSRPSSLIFGSLLLLGGRAADLLRRRRVFLTGLGVFMASSPAAALAGAGQGLGAGRVDEAAAGSALVATIRGALAA